TSTARTGLASAQRWMVSQPGLVYAQVGSASMAFFHQPGDKPPGSLNSLQRSRQPPTTADTLGLRESPVPIRGAAQTSDRLPATQARQLPFLVLERDRVKEV